MRRLPDGKVVYDEDTLTDAAITRWFEKVGLVFARGLGVVSSLWLLYWLTVREGWRDVVEYVQTEPFNLAVSITFMTAVYFVGRWHGRKHGSD